MGNEHLTTFFLPMGVFENLIPKTTFFLPVGVLGPCDACPPNACKMIATLDKSDSVQFHEKNV
jgi:hypothetical protein